MRFEFATAGRIIFGPGVLSQVGPQAAGMGQRAAEIGQRALVVRGANRARALALLALLEDAGLTPVEFVVDTEPTTDLAREGSRLARDRACDLVIGFGGGSVLDAAKAIAALATNPGDPLEYLEVIGRGQPLTQPPLPVIAIPTTAGTGTEVTRNAVLLSPEHRVKVSLRHTLLLPRVALVDPELTYSMPPEVTASTGLDAFTQVLEPFVSSRANPLTDALCREGLTRVARSLRRAYQQPDDAAAREDMAVASLFGGLALANAGLGAVHGFAGPLGGMFPAPHGAVCARLLAPVMALNVRALRERAADHPALERYTEVARLITGVPDATAADGVAWVEALCADLAVPGLGAYGLTPADFPAVVEKAQQASSMRANPLPLSDAELIAVLEQAL